MKIKFGFDKIKKEKSRGILTAINLLTITLLLNIIFSFIPFQLDLTKNKIHSISPITKKILSQLDDVVEIKAFISEQLPPQLIPVRKNLLAVLENYKDLSKGKIRIAVIDPSKDEKAKQETESIGIAPLQFSTIADDKFQLAQGYFAVAIAYGDTNEVIPTLENFTNLEYHLTSTIKKLTAKKLKTIAFTDGHNENSLQQTSIITQAIKQSYNWQIKNFSDEEAALDNDIDVFIFNNPKEKFSQRSQLALDQIIQSSKGVLFLADKIQIDSNLIPNKVDNDLDELLTHYGFEIKNSLILDSSAVITQFQDRQGNLIIVPYPFWIRILKEGIHKEFAPLGGINTLVFNWASPIGLKKNAIPLVKTSPYSWEETNPILAPNRDFSKEIIEEQEAKIVAALQTNKIESFFSDKKLDPKLLKEIGIEKIISNQNSLKMIVVSDADFIQDDNLLGKQENLVFFMGLVDFLAQEEDLTQIRSKALSLYPITLTEESQKQIIRTLNLTLPILIPFLIYLAVLVIKKKIILKDDLR